MVNRPNLPGGKITIPRSMFESDLWRRSPIYWKVFCWIVARANFADCEKNGFLYRRGELVTTLEEIRQAAAHFENRKQITPTYKTIRSILTWLIGNGYITKEPIKSTTMRPGRTKAHTGAYTGAYVGIKITVVNYDTYQRLEKNRGRHHGRDLFEHGHDIEEEIKREEITQADQVPQELPASGFHRISDLPVRLSIETICADLASPKARDDKAVFPQSYKFVNHCLNEGYRAEAILHALKQLPAAGPIKSPWPYAEQITRRKSQNMNEADHLLKHERLKREMPLKALLERS